MEITKIILRQEESFLYEDKLAVAEIETSDGFTYFASRLPDNWHVYFACHEDDMLPLWSHGVEALGVGTKTFTDRRIAKVLDLMVSGQPDYDLEVNCLTLFNRLMLEVEGQQVLDL